MSETFGVRFARLRKEKGLTQEEIATKLSISPQAVSKWENDSSYPDVTSLGDLSDLLGVTIDELLGKEKPITAYSPAPEGKKKDIKDMILHVNVVSADGDKIKVNVPVSIVLLALQSGEKFNIKGSDALSKVDFGQIIQMIESGVIGKLVEVTSADGDLVDISVE